MGTRSLTKVIEDGKIIINMYRQMDGYPGGHGKDLAEFLDGIKMVNGIGVEKTGTRIANGYGCLAAQVVEHFKSEAGVGGIYLYSPLAKDCGQEYEYEIHGKYGVSQPSQPVLKVFEARWKKPRKLLFEGSPAEVLAWIAVEESK